MILLDTNLLTRMTRSQESQAVTARAAMQSYGISRLLTFNIDHFRTLPITIIDPLSP